MNAARLATPARGVHAGQAPKVRCHQPRRGGSPSPAVAWPARRGGRALRGLRCLPSGCGLGVSASGETTAAGVRGLDDRLGIERLAARCGGAASAAGASASASARAPRPARPPVRRPSAAASSASAVLRRRALGLGCGLLRRRFGDRLGRAGASAPSTGVDRGFARRAHAGGGGVLRRGAPRQRSATGSGSSAATASAALGRGAELSAVASSTSAARRVAADLGRPSALAALAGGDRHGDRDGRGDGAPPSPSLAGCSPATRLSRRRVLVRFGLLVLGLLLGALRPRRSPSVALSPSSRRRPRPRRRRRRLRPPSPSSSPRASRARRARAFARFGLVRPLPRSSSSISSTIVVLDLLDRAASNLRRVGGRRAAGLDRHARAFLLAVGQDLDRHAVAILDLGEVGALAVEHVERRFLAARAA